VAITSDRTLADLGAILQREIRGPDFVARYGGDEFALVLPEAEEDEARLVASRIREVLAKDDEQPPLSASIGISVYRGDGERIEKLLSEADRDLYAEKARRGKRATSATHPRRRTPKA
jgi:diguanylate cyclase (GGDEF)-like protein